MLINQKESCLFIIDIQKKLTPHVMKSDILLQRCRWLIEVAKKREIPIILSEQYPKGLGTTIESLVQNISLEQELVKTHFSCASAPHFLEKFKQLHKKQCILIGIETHVCILQTALELKALDFEVFVVVDAVSSRHELDHKYALKRMKQDGVHLVTAEMVFFEWIRDSSIPEFKSLSKEFLQN